MAMIFGSMFLGILVGYFKWMPKAYMASIHRFIFITMIILLLFLGAEVGSDPDTLGKIYQLGLQSFVIAVFSVGGSVLFLGLMSKLWPIRIEKEEEKP